MTAIALYNNELDFMRFARKEAESFLRSPADSTARQELRFSFHDHTSSKKQIAYDVTDPQALQDIFKQAQVAGTIFAAISAIACYYIIKPLIQENHVAHLCAHHIQQAKKQQQMQPTYYFVANAMQEIHTLKISRIHKLAIALFALIGSSIALVGGGVGLSIAFVKIGYALAAGSCITAVITELWHAQDELILQQNYEKILHDTSHLSV